MNPLDEKINQAVEDLRNDTGRTMRKTREVVLARMRRERILRWSLGGGGAALLSLAMYLAFGMSEPQGQPVDWTSAPVEQRLESADNATNQPVVLGSNQTSRSRNDSVDHTGRLPKQGANSVSDVSDGYQKMQYEQSLDAFNAESTAIAKRALEAVAANDLVRAAKTYRGLARLCEKRLEWTRAVTAYDSASAYASLIGDKRLLLDLSREQALASKNASHRD